MQSEGLPIQAESQMDSSSQDRGATNSNDEGLYRVERQANSTLESGNESNASAMGGCRTSLIHEILTAGITSPPMQYSNFQFKQLHYANLMTNRHSLSESIKHAIRTLCDDTVRKLNKEQEGNPCRPQYTCRNFLEDNDIRFPFFVLEHTCVLNSSILSSPAFNCETLGTRSVTMLQRSQCPSNKDSCNWHTTQHKVGIGCKVTSMLMS